MVVPLPGYQAVVGSSPTGRADVSFFLLTMHSLHISFGLPGVGSGARIADNSEVIR